MVMHQVIVILKMRQEMRKIVTDHVKMHINIVGIMNNVLSKF